MSRPSYPLRAVEEQRRRQRDEAQKKLGSRIEELEAARRALEVARETYRRLDTRHDEARRDLYTGDEPLDVAAIARRRRGLEFIAQRLARQAENVGRRDEDRADAEQQVLEARRRLATSAQALGAIEKHRERWQEELDTAERREEEKLMNEIATSAYARAARDGGSGP